MSDHFATAGDAITERLYFEDAYAREFEARVTESLTHDGRPAVTLDRTLFYPESGGQPADTGTLGGARVLDVQEAGERVIHALDREVPAARVRGVIDWPRRFDHMQQHTGQHILSQCFIERLAGETMSFHLGPEVSTLEIGLRSVSDGDLERVEDLANAVILENREIRTYFVAEDAISSVPLRRPPKKAGRIRVVEVDGFDFSACGGTHCRRTGEVGLVKILRSEKIRNNLRFEFVCGGRAVRDYARKNRLVLELAGKLSVREGEAPAAVDRLAAEAREARKNLRRLQEALAGLEARELAARADGPLVVRSWTDKSAEEAKLLALNLSRAGDLAALFGVPGADRSRLIFAASEKLGLNLRELVPLIQGLAPAKGGGSPSLVELVVEPGVDLEPLLAAAAAHLRQKLPA